MGLGSSKPRKIRYHSPIVSIDTSSGIAVNHRYNNPGEITCDTVRWDNPCFSDGHCIPERSCWGEYSSSGIAVNHRYDNPGEITCGIVPWDDSCFSDGTCIPEKSCSAMNVQADSTGFKINDDYVRSFVSKL